MSGPALVIGLDDLAPFDLGPGTYAHLQIDVFGGSWLLLPGTFDAGGLGEFARPGAARPGAAPVSGRPRPRRVPER